MFDSRKSSPDTGTVGGVRVTHSASNAHCEDQELKSSFLAYQARTAITNGHRSDLHARVGHAHSKTANLAG